MARAVANDLEGIPGLGEALRDKLRAEKILQDKLFEKAANGNIRLHWNQNLDEVLGDASGVTGIRIKSLTSAGLARRSLRTLDLFVQVDTSLERARDK